MSKAKSLNWNLALSNSWLVTELFKPYKPNTAMPISLKLSNLSEYPSNPLVLVIF